MSNKNKPCEILMGTTYARFGFELEASGLIDKHTWAVVKKDNLDEIEQEVVKLWDTIISICWNQSVTKMREWAADSNKIIEKMPDEDRLANQLLLSVHLFSEWLDMNCADFVTKAVWGKRIGRLKLKIIEKVEGVSGNDIVSRSYIAANNISRYLRDKPMLDSTIRNAATARLKRKMKSGGTK